MKTKTKTEIKPGQIWRDKRDHARQIRVTKYEEGYSPGGNGFSMRVSYSPYNYAPRIKRNGRPVSELSFELSFRFDYELVSAPTEAQKERRGEEG